MECEKMKEETQEVGKRYRVLSEIKTAEEYDAAKNRLEYYMREYTWMQETEDPIKEVRKEIEKLLPMLNQEKTPSQKYYLRCINLLSAKERRIKDGSYLPSLKRNITALLVTTRQYEQNQKEYTLKDLFQGIIKRDKSILEALKLDHIFSSIMTFGNVQAEEDLSMQKPEDILQYIGMHCNLVGIEMPDYQQNLDLIPVDVEHGITPYQEFISQMVGEYIQENSQGKHTTNQHRNHKRATSLEVGYQNKKETFIDGSKTERNEHSKEENQRETPEKAIKKGEVEK